jgi:hypothetical protein
VLGVHEILQNAGFFKITSFAWLYVWNRRHYVDLHQGDQIGRIFAHMGDCLLLTVFY